MRKWTSPKKARRLQADERAKPLSHNEKKSVQVVQVKKIGNSLGVIFPKELLARLKLKEGDMLPHHRADGAGRKIKSI